MAKFKVGDRVRIVSASAFPDLVGKQATVAGQFQKLKDPNNGEIFFAYPIEVDGMPYLDQKYGAPFSAKEYQLAPATPPAIDEWATEQVKRVTKPQPVTDRVIDERLVKQLPQSVWKSLIVRGAR